MTPRRKARVFKIGDEPLQLPDRDCRRPTKAILDTVLGQCGGDDQFVMQYRICLRVHPCHQRPDLGLPQGPRPVGQLSFCCLDPAHWAATFGIGHEHHVIKHGSVGVRPRGPDHRLPAWVGLAQPQPFGSDRQRRGAAIAVGFAQVGIGLGRCRHDRVAHRHSQAANHRRHHNRPHQRRQARPPRRARHHQFGRPCQCQEQRDGGQDHHQGQDLVHALGCVQQGQLDHFGKTDRIV